MRTPRRSRRCRGAGSPPRLLEPAPSARGRARVASRITYFTHCGQRQQRLDGIGGFCLTLAATRSPFVTLPHLHTRHATRGAQCCAGGATIESFGSARQRHSRRRRAEWLGRVPPPKTPSLRSSRRPRPASRRRSRMRRREVETGLTAVASALRRLVRYRRVGALGDLHLRRYVDESSPRRPGRERLRPCRSARAKGRRASLSGCWPRTRRPDSRWVTPGASGVGSEVHAPRRGSNREERVLGEDAGDRAVRRRSSGESWAAARVAWARRGSRRLRQSQRRSNGTAQVVAARCRWFGAARPVRRSQP